MHIFLNFLSQSFALFPSLHYQHFFLSFLSSLFYIFLFWPAEKKLKPRLTGRSRLHVSTEIRARKHKCFKWTPADRHTGQGHNAAIFPPCSVKLSVLTDLLFSHLWITGAFMNAKKVKKQLITVTWGKSCHCPQCYGHTAFMTILLMHSSAVLYKN